nr:phospholipase-like protein [Tanacetum cinerariifolium]
MGELINMLLAFNFSQYAFESLKLLKELQEYKMAKKVVTDFLILRTFPFYDKGYDIELMGNLCDEDAVRVCVLLSLEEIFMGDYIWRHLYDHILNVVSKHKWEHLHGLSRSHKYIPTYVIFGFFGLSRYGFWSLVRKAFYGGITTKCHTEGSDVVEEEHVY